MKRKEKNIVMVISILSVFLLVMLPVHQAAYYHETKFSYHVGYKNKGYSTHVTKAQFIKYKTNIEKLQKAIPRIENQVIKTIGAVEYANYTNISRNFVQDYFTFNPVLSEYTPDFLAFLFVILLTISKLLFGSNAVSELIGYGLCCVTTLILALPLILLVGSIAAWDYACIIFDSEFLNLQQMIHKYGLIGGLPLFVVSFLVFLVIASAMIIVLCIPLGITLFWDIFQDAYFYASNLVYAS